MLCRIRTDSPPSPASHERLTPALCRADAELRSLTALRNPPVFRNFKCSGTCPILECSVFCSVKAASPLSPAQQRTEADDHLAVLGTLINAVFVPFKKNKKLFQIFLPIWWPITPCLFHEPCEHLWVLSHPRSWNDGHAFLTPCRPLHAVIPNPANRLASIIRHKSHPFALKRRWW